MRMAEIGTDHHIVEHTHTLKGSGHLEGAADPEAGMRFGRRVGHILTAENHSAAGGYGVACEAVKKCGFAGAIGPYQTYDLAFINGQIRLAHRKETAERLGNRLRFKQHACASSVAVTPAPTIRRSLRARNGR